MQVLFAFVGVSAAAGLLALVLHTPGRSKNLMTSVRRYFVVCIILYL